MSEYIPKLIDGNHYLLWIDALHSRALAKQAVNKWDKAAYVRWTILMSWTVLELACQDSLENPKISYSFQKTIKQTLNEKNLPSLDWGVKTWQKVIQLQELRKNIAHRFADESDLFPDEEIADFAILVVREAVKSIYEKAKKNAPAWIEDDSDKGWSGRRGSGAIISCEATLTVVRKGAQDAGNPIKVYFTCNERESLSDVLPPDYDYFKIVEDILSNADQPISHIKVVRGEEMLYEKSFNTRGS